jgi:uncharacterized membrane protein
MEQSPRMVQELLVIGILLAPLAYLWSIWNALPEQVPMHFDFQGEVTRHGSKSELWIVLLALALPIYIIMSIVPLAETKEKQTPEWKRSFFQMRLLLQLCMSALGAIVVYTTYHGSMEPMRPIGVVLGLLFAGLGWIMGLKGEQGAMGLNMPWLDKHPEARRRTYRFSSWAWSLGGLMAIPVFFLLPGEYLVAWSLIMVLVLSALPIAYSSRALRWKNS